MKKLHKNILLVAGSGRNVGKTTFMCKTIKNLQAKKLTAVKITPHFHETTPGLKQISETSDYKIFEETNPNTGKDSSRYLKSGAKKSFLIQTKKQTLPNAFNELNKFLSCKNPIIIESGGLTEVIKPGLFVFVTDNKTSKTEADILLLTQNLILGHIPDLVFSDGWKVKTDIPKPK